MTTAAATATWPIEETINALVQAHGETARARAAAGVPRAAALWRDTDGDGASFTAFCLKHFVHDGAERTRLMLRLETALEQVSGHLYEMRRSLRRWSDLRGDEFPSVDDLLATFDPAPDLSEQLYRQKVAFVALLNLDRPTLARMLSEGDGWSIDQWAEARIAQSFGPRIPAELADRARATGHRCQQWVSTFHVPVGGMVDAQGKRWFETDRKLIAHWLVREEIKAGYNDPEGLQKQRALSWVMARHIDGTIPAAVMKGVGADWDPQSNMLAGNPVCATGPCGGATGQTVGLARYEHWIEQFRLAQAYDAHHPEHPTAIARKFDLAREIPETDVERLLVELLEHPVRAQLASMLRERLGRALEPFDIYFDDISEARPAEEMNAAVTRLFPDEGAFERALPQVLRGLGWPDDEADFLGSHIKVEIAKGAGHAMRPMLTQYGAWLRTNRLKECLGWDGFDTAMHELGHNLEQLCSTYYAPRPALRNVPNTACTEAFAFLYQGLAKKVLGIEPEGGEQRQFAIDSVQTMLAACQIAGPSLLELHAWRWLYANPGADAAALRAEVLAIADRLWTRFYERDFGPDPYRILAAYQHMIAHPLYLADYTLGHIMSHQIRSFMRGKDVAAQTRRITSLGRFTPDLWMRKATGSPISARALAEDCATALKSL
jgi:hypothetical protein